MRGALYRAGVAGGALFALGLVVAALLPSASPPADPPSAPLDVAWSGCAHVARGPICETPATVTLWIPPTDPACPPEVYLDDRPVAAASAAVDGGRRLRLAAAASHRRIRIMTCGALRWQLDLRPAAPAPELDALEAQRTADPAAALAGVEALTASSPEDAAAWALQAKLRASLQGIDAARPDFARAIDLATRDGRISQMCDARFALAHHLREALHLDEASRVLDEAACAAGPPETQAHWPYYQATVALETFDVARALDALSLATRRQRRLDDRAYLPFTLQQRGRALALLGRFVEAWSVLQEAREISQGCFRAHVDTEMVWTAQLAREAGQSVVSAKQAILRARAARDAAVRCPAADRLVRDLSGNLAFALLSAGRPREAARELARARGGPGAAAQSWWREAEGLIAAARGDHRAAIAVFEALLSDARARRDDAMGWRAGVALGRELEATGRPKAALAAYRSAEERLDRLLARAPFGEGRARFADAHSEGTTRRLALLFRLGRPDEAFEVARQSLRRGLAHVTRVARLAGLSAEARQAWAALVGRYRVLRAQISGPDQWRRPAAELARLRAETAELEAALTRRLGAPTLASRGRPAPAALAGQMQLVLHPLPDGAWLVASRLDGAARGHRLEGLDVSVAPAELAARLLPPLAAHLDAAARVVVLAPGALGGLDVHALPWRGRPLLVLVPVHYGLDLESAIAPPPVPTAGLIAHDLTEGLPEALQEARDVHAALARARMSDATDAPTLAAALAAADHFHYAGHGRAAGPDGRDSALVLDDRLTLTSPDILTLESVPRTVVLSGCDLGQTDPVRHTRSLGLAQAFLVAGAARVVAPARRIRDRDARAFSRALYAALPSASTFDDAVRVAQLGLADADPDVDWAAFRLLAP